MESEGLEQEPSIKLMPPSEEDMTELMLLSGTKVDKTEDKEPEAESLIRGAAKRQFDLGFGQTRG